MCLLEHLCYTLSIDSVVTVVLDTRTLDLLYKLKYRYIQQQLGHDSTSVNCTDMQCRSSHTCHHVMMMFTVHADSIIQLGYTIHYIIITSSK